MIDRRAHIVTPDLTYRGHIFTLSDDGTAELLDRERTTVIRTLTAAEATSRDGQVHRITGTGPDGEPTIWRVVGACARCAAPSVYPTPAYDIPT